MESVVQSQWLRLDQGQWLGLDQCKVSHVENITAKYFPNIELGIFKTEFYSLTKDHETGNFTLI